MKVIRKFAVQGHPVPEMAYRPTGLFAQEVLARPKIRHSDDESEMDPNGFRMFLCRECGEVVPWDDINDHECEDI